MTTSVAYVRNGGILIIGDITISPLGTTLVLENLTRYQVERLYYYHSEGKIVWNNAPTFVNYYETNVAPNSGGSGGAGTDREFSGQWVVDKTTNPYTVYWLVITEVNGARSYAFFDKPGGTASAVAPTNYGPIVSGDAGTVSLNDTTSGATSATLTTVGSHTFDTSPIPAGLPTITTGDVNIWQQVFPAKPGRQLVRIQNLSETKPLYVKIGTSNCVMLAPMGSEVWENTIIPTEAIYVSGPVAGEAFSAITDA